MRSSWIGAMLVVLALAGCGPTPVETRGPAATSSPSTPPTTEPPSATLAPGPSATGSLLPSPDPSPAGTPIGVVRIPFAGREMEVALLGEPGVLAAWRAATDNEIRKLPLGDADISLAALADRKLVLGWIGTVCDVKASLAVGRAQLVVSPAPREGCDAMALARGLVLTFAQPVDPAKITVVLEPRVLLPEGG
jgi:hypothetical protein